MKKHNIKKLEEKLKSCKDIDLSEISMDDVDELSEIKIIRRKNKEEKILDFIKKFLSKVLKFVEKFGRIV